MRRREYRGLGSKGGRERERERERGREREGESEGLRVSGSGLLVQFRVLDVSHKLNGRCRLPMSPLLRILFSDLFQFTHIFHFNGLHKGD